MAATLTHTIYLFWERYVAVTLLFCLQVISQSVRAHNHLQKFIEMEIPLFLPSLLALATCPGAMHAVEAG